MHPIESDKSRWQVSLGALIAAAMFLSLVIGFFAERHRLTARIKELRGYQEAWRNSDRHALKLQEQLELHGRMMPKYGRGESALVHDLAEKGAVVMVAPVSVHVGPQAEIRDDDIRNVAQLNGIRELSLQADSLTGASLEHLRLLENLEHLALHGEWVSNDGMAKVAELDRLKSLWLSGLKNVSVSGFEHLNQLDGLRELHLSGPNVTDAVIESLSGLSSITTLRVKSTALTNDGVRHLSHFSELRVLDLSHNGISNVEYEAIAAMPELKVLWLDSTQISDQTIDTLSRLAQLEELHLSDTSVTDAGVLKLRRMARLRVLGLAKTPHVTAEAVAALRQTLPQCDVRTGKRK